jgi:ribosomal-protein-alanine N-acetyltransferase
MLDTGSSVYRVDIMTQDDVPSVSRVERRCFANPWPTSAYRRELQNPTQTYYIVLREQQQESDAPHTDIDAASSNGVNAHLQSRGVPRRSLLPIGLGRRPEGNGADPQSLIGFAGMWLAFDEAHVTTIGIDPDSQGRGLGELLLLCLFDEAVARGANWLTLEVRVSNDAAQSLYRKYGFTVHGTRRRYYSDNNEDALIMWTRPLSDNSYRHEIDALRDALAARLGSQLAGGEVSPFATSFGRAAAS